MTELNDLISLHHLTHSNGIWMGVMTQDISYPESAHEDLIHFEEQSFWFKYRNQLIYRIFKQFAKKPMLLDVGGGGGIVSKYLQDQGVNTVLVEPLKQGALIASKRGLKHILCANFESLHFKEKVANIGCFDVIEHIEHDALFLKNIAERLDDKGSLFVTVPAHQFLWSQADVDAGHYRRYSRKSLIRLFQDSGFEVKYCAYFFTYLVPLIYVLGRKKTGESSQEHIVTGWKRIIINFLNRIDGLLIKVFGGRFVGASLIIVAGKRV